MIAFIIRNILEFKKLDIKVSDLDRGKSNSKLNKKLHSPEPG